MGFSVENLPHPFIFTLLQSPPKPQENKMKQLQFAVSIFNFLGGKKRQVKKAKKKIEKVEQSLVK